MARILVVDDDPDILRMADRTLTQAQHVVMTAPDAVKAMELLQTGMFDVLVSDANMPLYSGFELVQTIRSNNRFSHLAIIMLTGLRERKDVEKALKVGVDDYMVKPLDPLLLVQKIESLLEKKPPQQKPEIIFSALGSGSQAQLSFTVRMESVSELGV